MTSCRHALIIPVLDIKGGDVVAATGGDRKKYEPVSASIFTSPNPIAVVKSYQALFNFSVFYVADLDAIMGHGDNSESIANLLGIPDCEFMIDGGYRKLSDTQRYEGATHVIATETFMDWSNAKQLSGATISIDTRNGKLVSPFPDLTIEHILQKARESGASRFIHLRLDGVGTKSFSPEKLIRPMENEEWIAGGGVRSKDDLKILAATGYSGALVATALYEGLLP